MEKSTLSYNVSALIGISPDVTAPVMVHFQEATVDKISSSTPNIYALTV